MVSIVNLIGAAKYLITRTATKIDRHQGNLLIGLDEIDSTYCFSKEKPTSEDFAFFVKSWRLGRWTRRPFPGFSPHVYAAQNPEVGLKDPTLHYLENNKPTGPWIREVVRPTSLKPRSSKLRLAVHIHIFFPDLLSNILIALNTNANTPHLFITFPPSVNVSDLQFTLAAYQGLVTYVPLTGNHGRDLGPLFSHLPVEFFKDFDVVGHVHTKKSLGHRGSGSAEQWFSFALTNLFGSAKAHGMLDEIVSRFETSIKLGMVYPDDPNVMGWGKNFKIGRTILPKIDLPASGDLFDFPVGSFFLARPAALAPLLQLALRDEDFPSEPVPYDGTILHALERLLGISSSLSNLETAVTFVPGCTR
jgi:lipopolysaccharide biosynthesis protein